MKLPLAGYRAARDPVLLGPEGTVTAALFFAQARALAAALPGAPFVINLCESRHGFMLGFAAALMRGQTSLLPPGRGRGDWQHLLRRFPDACLLSDEALEAESFFHLGPFLEHRAADALEVPQVDAERTAAILFTSGSTGAPAAHPKTWGQLWRGAAHLAEALHWGERPACAVVGSVSPQHMFGLEATVMLPWYAGVPVHARKPLLAADIDAALRQCDGPCWWMTTPVQLRAPLQSAAPLAGLEGILASTMNLPAELAAAAESTWKVPVREIYGSTETGALAIRRTANEDTWTPLAGVSLWREADGDGHSFWAAGPHVGERVRLGDDIDLHPDGRFRWLGRSSDLVKVAGRRASLSALNRSLGEVPGVDDGVYVFPEAAGDATTSVEDESRPARRLAALYVSASLSPREVLDALRARIDPAFLPRPLYRVAGLPRNENGKLPQAALAGLLAQCRQEAGRARTMAVPADHPALPGHFPGRPIVPGVVILARVAEAIAAQLPQVEPDALLYARFHAPLAPGESFVVVPRLEGERVRFEVRLAEAAQVAPGTLIVSGQWACRSRQAA